MSSPNCSDDVALTNKLGTSKVIDHPTNARDSDKEKLKRKRRKISINTTLRLESLQSLSDYTVLESLGSKIMNTLERSGMLHMITSVTIYRFVGSIKIQTPKPGWSSLVPWSIRIMGHRTTVILRPENRRSGNFFKSFAARGQAKTQKDSINDSITEADGSSDDVTGHDFKRSA